MIALLGRAARPGPQPAAPVDDGPHDRDVANDAGPLDSRRAFALLERLVDQRRRRHTAETLVRRALGKDDQLLAALKRDDAALDDPRDEPTP